MLDGRRVCAGTDNVLYCGDNLSILRRHMKDESVDLAYLDPQFNSNANYNMLFAVKDGLRATAPTRPTTMKTGRRQGGG